MNKARENLHIQKWVFATAVLLFAIKITAYFLTRSVAVLTDALESIANILASLVGWFSLYVSAKPKDTDHPYGHGKAEFISAGVEGTLVTFAGLFIIYQGVNGFIHPHKLEKLDYGFILMAISGIINFILGTITVQKGKRNNSLALIASGKHLQSDTYSTLGIMVGLALIYFTRKDWIDNVVAIIFALIVIRTGYKIIRSSIAGIMDEADIDLLKNIIDFLDHNRRTNWIDLHNLRVIKYGGLLHLDCHLTVPWYVNVNEAHKEVDELRQLIRSKYGDVIELLVHIDGCLDFSCSLCRKFDCPVRRRPFEKQVQWTLQNVILNEKHHLA